MMTWTTFVLFFYRTVKYATSKKLGKYRNDPKFSDRYAWANSADPDQTDQGLHCLPFRLHRLDSLLCGRAT